MFLLLAAAGADIASVIEVVVAVIDCVVSVLGIAIEKLGDQVFQ